MKTPVLVTVVILTSTMSFAETPKQEATRLCTEYVRIEKVCYIKALKGNLPTNMGKIAKSRAPKELIEMACKEGFELFSRAGKVKEVELNRASLRSYNRCFDDFTAALDKKEENEYAPVSGYGHKGEVLETMDSAGYTYARIAENGKELWVACMQTSVEVGDTIEFPDSPPMANFRSKPLNRTFNKIIFAPGINVVE
jgi:hypothetical protein